MAQQQSLSGGAEHFRNQIVHVRDNSGNTLDELFKVAYQPTPSSGWRDRQLPDSFFNPPGIGSGGQEVEDVTPQPPRSALTVKHSRSRSSPAQLHNPPLSVSQQPPVHFKQHSIGDALDDRQNVSRISSAGWINGTPDFNFHHMGPHTQKSKSSINSPSVELNCVGDAVLQALLSPMPHGWEMSLTQDGEIYFINHLDRNTSWFLPTMPQELQRRGKPIRITQLPPQYQQLLQKNLQQNQVPCSGAQNSSIFQHTDQVTLELQKLQLEREKLKRQQDEINKREQMLLEKAQGGSGPPSSTVDPFLCQEQENHVRQSSTDSGLGGMAATYSLPKTSEDYLCNVDGITNTVDDTKDKGSGKALPQQADFNMNEMQTNMDMESMDTSNLPIPMDDAEYINIPDLSLDNPMWL